MLKDGDDVNILSWGGERLASRRRFTFTRPARGDAAPTGQAAGRSFRHKRTRRDDSTGDGDERAGHIFIAPPMP